MSATTLKKVAMFPKTSRTNPMKVMIAPTTNWYGLGELKTVSCYRIYNCGDSVVENESSDQSHSREYNVNRAAALKASSPSYTHIILWLKSNALCAI